MTIETRLNDDLKAAMKAKDSGKLSCIRQVRAKMQETVNAKGFEGEVDDALYKKVISSYVKMLKKGLEELAGAGDKGAGLRDSYQAEIDYLDQYLPKMLGEDETRKLVEAAIADQGITDPKQAGRVVGAVMKDHKGSVDPGLVKRLAQAALEG